MCPAPVAAWLQHLTLLRPAPYSPTLSRSGSALWIMVLLFVGVWRECAMLRVLAAGDSTHAAVGSLGPGLCWFPPTSVLGNPYSPFGCLCVRTGAKGRFLARREILTRQLATRLDGYSLLEP